MTVERSGTVTVGGVRLAYVEHGDPGARAVVCVHGLTRNARDFDPIARALAPHRRVIALDVAGRGGSDRLADPAQYQYPVYLQHALGVLDALGLDQVDWLGTSMGGLIGMTVAASAPGRIRRLVLNDVGLFIPQAAVQRIADYLSALVSFADLGEAEAYFRRVLQPFGALDDADWAEIARTSVWTGGDGRLVPAYDPGIAEAFRQVPLADVVLWPLWSAIRCPVLLLRGIDSDLLLRPTALGMVAGGDVTLLEFQGCGHAPALRSAEQIDPVRDWLITA